MTSKNINFNLCGKVRSAGFSLVELSMVLAIVALLFVFVMPTSSVILQNKKRELTRQKLTNIETALVNYVAVNKRLPCPASVTSPMSGEEGGRDATGDCTDNQVGGVVPWVAIGMTKSDVEDGWDRLVTYKAAYALTRNGALDMSSCDPAGTGATDGTASPGGKCLSTCVSSNMAACTSPQNYLLNKGFVVRFGLDAGLTEIIMDPANYTGAAFVLISHGQSGFGAHRSDGSDQSDSTTGTVGSIETYNLANTSVTSTAPISANTFRDADFSEGAASEYFDDVLIRPSVFSIIQRAHLGPRSH